MIHKLSIENLPYKRKSTIKNLYDSEAYLVEQCGKQNEEAQKVLYENNYSQLLGVCIRYVSNVADAEDILQESFVQIFKKIKTFKGEAKLSSWLVRIVINNSLAFLRKRKRIQVEYKNKWDGEEYEQDIPEEDIADLSCEQIIDLMNCLPVGYKTVLCLYSIDGYSHKEIAQILNITESSSRSQLSRARKLFKQQLKKEAKRW